MADTGITIRIKTLTEQGRYHIRCTKCDHRTYIDNSEPPRYCGYCGASSKQLEVMCENEVIG